MRLYGELAEMRLYGELAEMRLYGELAEMRLYGELAEMRLYGELAEMRLYGELAEMRLYGELAEWWPLLDDPADYASATESVRAAQDRHVEGLFARGRWFDLLASVGFEARSVPLVLSDVEPGRHEMFVGRRSR